MSQCMFTYSPLGRGLDCHRTWECMCLGGIAIVQWSPILDWLKPLNLPLVAVKDHTAITPTALHRWAKELGPYRYRGGPMGPLGAQFWKDRIARGV